MTRRSRANEATEILFHGGALLDAPRAARKSPASRGRASGGGRGSGGEALLVRGDRIAAVGPLSTLQRQVSRRAVRVDLGGGTLMPGFTDAHIHLITWIRALREPWLDAQTVLSIERAVAARLQSAPNEEWLLLRGWVPREWSPELRVRRTLDAVTGAALVGFGLRLASERRA